MQIISASPFSFNYTAYDQSGSLYVAFSIYDVTSGTPSFITKINAQYSAFGAYMAGYTGTIGKTYLVIGLVYTDNTYATVDVTRAPSADVFQFTNVQALYIGVAYAAFDLATGLSMQASVYDMSTGSPVFVQTASMAHVYAGVYFGSFTGTLNKTYQIAGVVYTDGSYSTVNFTYAPSCDEFDCITLNPTYILNEYQVPTLIGQSLNAVLMESA